MTPDMRHAGSWTFWTLAVGAVGALLATVANVFVDHANQQLEQRVNEQQRVINEGVRLSRLNSHLVQALANVAAQTEDPAIRDLLAGQGITYTVKPVQKGGSSNGK